jgi:transcriptional regulator with XRE-family HTH domain
VDRFADLDGTKLRALRKRRALSQRDLARTSGVGPVTISELERGVRGARPRTIRGLAEALDVEPTELMKGAGMKYVSVRELRLAAQILNGMPEGQSVRCGWQPDPESPPCGSEAEFLVSGGTRVSAGGDIEIGMQWRCKAHLQRDLGAPVREEPIFDRVQGFGEG